MLSLKSLIKFAENPESYIWVDALLIKETPKAILVVFDGKEIWLPKAWILRIKHFSRHCGPRSGMKRLRALARGSAETNRARPISLKISECHWAKKT